jgi:hypothetical protein
MSTKSLLEILKTRYENESLANLYILNYDSKNINPMNWVNEFLAQITIVKNDHPDVLFIARNPEENDYKVDGEQWAQLRSFIQYHPYVLKNKFVFIFDAHKITEIISNKLLKTFEDSPAQLCIFLLLKDQQSLLPTILSRAIHLPIFSNKTEISSYQFKSHQNPTKITEEIKSLDEGESLFISSVIDSQLSNAPDYKQINELLQSLHNNQNYAEFNNSLSSRIALILP